MDMVFDQKDSRYGLFNKIYTPSHSLPYIIKLIMITPDFKLQQTDSHVLVFIRLPYIKVTQCEFHIESAEFKFYLKPYLLSLAFQQSLAERQEPEKAVYYHEKHVLEVHLAKQNKGEHFQGLELMQSVLNAERMARKKSKAKVQVLEEGKGVLEHQGSIEKQNIYSYGFCLNYSKVMENLQEQTHELFAFNPRNIPLPQRRAMSLTLLNEHFDSQLYFFDKYQNEEEVFGVLKDPSAWRYLKDLLQIHQGKEVSRQAVKVRQMVGRKQLLVPANRTRAILRQIISIVFSYLYQLWCMGGEFGPESARTINRTSAVLHCNCLDEKHLSMRELLAECTARCMTYSLYRHMEVGRAVQQVLTKVLDRQWVKLILIDLRSIFEQNQPRYLLNTLYLDDYICFLFHHKVDWEQLGKEILNCQISETDLPVSIQEDNSRKSSDSDDDQSDQEKESKQQKTLVQQMNRLETLD